MSESPKHVEHDAGKHGRLRLYRPRNYSRVIQIQRLAVEHDETVLACAAALGLAWQSGPSDHKPKADWVRLKGAWRYGEAVMDELVERGWTMMDIVTAGNAALPIVLAMLSDMVSEAEVEAAEGFTGPGEG